MWDPDPSGGLQAHRRVEVRLDQVWWSLTQFYYYEDAIYVVKSKVLYLGQFLVDPDEILVQIKRYPMCFDTPNLILIRREKTEIWGHGPFQRAEGVLQMGFQK